MPEREGLDRRLRAVERTLTGDDRDIDALTQAGDIARRVDELEASLEDARARIEELEAANQALRGYVGNVRSVNEEVEQRADVALAAVDRLETRIAQTRAGETRIGQAEIDEIQTEETRVDETRTDETRTEQRRPQDQAQPRGPTTTVTTPDSPAPDRSISDDVGSTDLIHSTQKNAETGDTDDTGNTGENDPEISDEGTVLDRLRARL